MLTKYFYLFKLFKIENKALKSIVIAKECRPNQAAIMKEKNVAYELF